MEEDSNHWHKGGGYLVLLVVAIFLFFGWRIGLADKGVVETDGEETAVSSPISSQQNPDGATAFSSDQAPLYDFSTGDLPVFNDTGLAPQPNPHTYEGKLPHHEFETYTVERGDTPGTIAEQFGIAVETLLGGNARLSQETTLLQPGDVLIILPIDAVLHEVQPGDTLESVSEQYDIPVEDIIAYTDNNLEFPYRLYPETNIMVPGAKREVVIWQPPTVSSSGGSGLGGGIAPKIVGTGTFQFPVNNRNFTQFYWYGHPAIDIALGEGNAVFASDTGTVTYAGWNTWGYGNLIVINHGNGYDTIYAHLSGINVVPGQIVYKGNVIGYTGNTGNSSGPHIHFEIRIGGNPDDPCWYLGCG
ncbi:MAG: M23 family metallopeptidase [Anaerolineae bacterium]|nr:M23 family metallopeptidase [Anaerolineae bacterium]